MRERLPEAGTAHSLMFEEPVQAPQYCLDGYVLEGQLHRLGVVDVAMYPGTQAFMRFDYPSRLSVAVIDRATDVVEAETSRLEARLSGVGPDELDEIRQALRRVADKLVHQPTVQVRRLTGETGDGSYAEALAALFALDPEAIEAVTRPEVG